jgi:hypothetical protein
MNVTLNDIKEIEGELNITLTNEGRETVLTQYERIVTDKADDWSVIIQNLIREYEGME